MKKYSKLMGIIFGVLIGVGMTTGYIMMSLTQEVVKQSVEEEMLITTKIISANLYSHIKGKKNDIDQIVLDKDLRNAPYHTFDALALFDEGGMLCSSGTLDVNYSEHLKAIPVIILTTSALETDLNKCYILGANSYIIKPIQFRDFVQKLRQIPFYWVHVNTLEMK